MCGCMCPNEQEACDRLSDTILKRPTKHQSAFPLGLQKNINMGVVVKNKKNQRRRYLGLCVADLIYEASLVLEVFVHDGNLLSGKADVVVQALVRHLAVHELLLRSVQFLPRHLQLPLELGDVPNARLVLWDQSGGAKLRYQLCWNS